MYFINKVDVVKDDEKIAAQVVIKNDVTGDTEVIFLNQEQYNKLCEEIDYIKDNCVIEEEIIDTINEITTADKGVNAMTLNGHKDVEFAKYVHNHYNLTDLVVFNNHVEKQASDKTLAHVKVVSEPVEEITYSNSSVAAANIVAKHTSQLKSINNRLVQDNEYIVSKDYIIAGNDTPPVIRGLVVNDKGDVISNRQVILTILSWFNMIILNPTVLTSNAEGKIEFTLDKSKFKDRGMYYCIFELRSDDKRQTVNQLVTHLYSRDYLG